jgi:hypothetical protein
MPYLGRQSGDTGQYIRCATITPDGSTTTFALTNVNGGAAVVPGSENNVLCSLSGVIQAPGTGNAFTISTSNIVFSTAPDAADVVDFVVVLGDTVLQGTPSDDTVSEVKLVNNAVTAGKLANTLDLSSKTVTLPEASVTAHSQTNYPTVTAISAIIPPSVATAVTITGTNFESNSTVVPKVEAISSAGVTTSASAVSRNSATSITATFNLALGDYRVRVANPDGLAGSSTNAILQASTAPTWTTAAGSLGSFGSGTAISETVVATSDSAVTYAKTSGTFPGGVTLNTSNGLISGTESGSSATTTYTFQITPTDAESQVGPAREFTITISHAAEGGGQFN